jgi:hypothetical protein
MPRGEKTGGTFAAPPDPEEERGFVWHCSHDHCRDLDRLSFLDLLLREGLIEKRWLFDPAFLALEVGEKDPAEWDTRTPFEMAKAAVGRLRGEEMTYLDTIEAIAAVWANLDTMQQGELLAALSEAAKIGKREARKDIEGQAAVKTINPALLAFAQQNLKEQLRIAFEGREYAVLWNDGKVGVMHRGSQSERSMMPEIASRHDFTTFYKNRKSPWWTTRAA